MQISTISYGSRAVRWAPWALAAIVYLAKLSIALRKAGWNVAYWSNWWDQSQYWRSAKSLASLDFHAREHWYPLLYPLLEAPFTRLTPAAPFVILDLMLFLFASVGFVRVASRFGVGRWFAMGVFCLTTILYPEVGNSWIEPWTTTLSACLIWLALADALDRLFLETRVPTRWRTARLGLILGAIPLARPADLVTAAVIFLFIAIIELRKRDGFRSLGLVILAGVAVIAAYLLLHGAIYGTRPTTYMRMSAEYGVVPTWLAWKAYLILIEPLPWFPFGQGLLQLCPWIVLGTAGLIAGCFFGTGKNRIASVLLLTVTLLYLWCMLCYVDLLPTGLWKWGNVNYFKWLLPLFGLFVIVLAQQVRKQPWAAGLSLVSVLAMASVHAMPIPAAPGEPARALRIDVPFANFETGYMAQSMVRDRIGVLRNTFEYHQVPNGGALLAIAQKRDFQGDESWFQQAPPSILWPQGAGARRGVLGGAPRHPSARLGVRWSIGLPCWLPPYPCGFAARTH